MNEALQFNAGVSPDCGNFRKRKLSRQYDPFEAHILEEADLFRGVIVHLSAGDERNRGKIHLEEARILDNQSVRSYLIELPNDMNSFGDLLVGENGI